MENIVTSQRRIVNPKVEPIGLQQAKLHLKVDDDFTADDDYILALIAATRQWAEDFQGRAFITQTWRLTMDRFPGYLDHNRPAIRDPYNEYRVIRIPRPPLQSISSVKYVGRVDAIDTSPPGWDIAYDPATRLHTVDPALYRVALNSEPGRIVPLTQNFWPYTELPLLSSALESVQIEFVCGYGNTPASVPPRVIAAMLLYLGHLYENRQSVVVGARAAAIEIPQSAKDLLIGDRVVSFA